MDFIKLFRGMLPVFTRSRLQEDITSAKTIYTTMVMPSLELFAKEFKGAPKSLAAKDLINELGAFIPVRHNTVASDLLKLYKKLEPLFEEVDKQIAFEFEDRIIPASMSVRAASVLRITNCLGFLNNMVMALVNIIMHEELCSEGVVMQYISDVTPGAKASAKNSMIDFGQLLRQLTTITDFTETLNSIPDITIDAKDVAAAFGTSLDPFNLGSSGLGFRGNPVYWVGMLAAEWQHSNYKVNEQRKRALEKRLIALKRAQQGTPSPQIERDLEVISSDIARIDERLRSYEEKIK